MTRIIERFSEENRNFVFAALAGFIVASVLLAATGMEDLENSPSLNASSNLTEVTFSGDGVEKSSLKVEVADTDEERRRGLMFREKLDEDRGMLFTWDKTENRSFWMKNTLIPLDIIFIDEEKNIINIEEAYPQPGANNSELRRYSSEEPARYVIESNLNYTDRNGVQESDNVSFSLR
jgi:uncharacterized membrane protein (UPF0127 family)